MNIINTRGAIIVLNEKVEYVNSLGEPINDFSEVLKDILQSKGNVHISWKDVASIALEVVEDNLLENIKLATHERAFKRNLNKHQLTHQTFGSIICYIFLSNEVQSTINKKTHLLFQHISVLKGKSYYERINSLIKFLISNKVSADKKEEEFRENKGETYKRKYFNDWQININNNWEVDFIYENARNRVLEYRTDYENFRKSILNTTSPFELEEEELNISASRKDNTPKEENDESESIDKNTQINLNTKVSNKSINTQKVNNDVFIFDYVALLEEFHLVTPVSLIKKLCFKEWKTLKKVFSNTSNDYGIVKKYSKKDNVFYLTLNEIGEEKAYVTIKKNVLIFEILSECDCDIKMEGKIFEELTLRKRFFNFLFKEFSYNIYDLIHSKKFATHDKQVLLYRLLGYQNFYDNDFELMRDSFERCINLLRKKNKKDSSSFYLDWATLEKKIGNKEREEGIYNIILEDFPYPKNLNRATRYNLSILYMKDQKINEAISLFSIDNYSLIKKPDFWFRFDRFIKDSINNGYSRDATVLQKVISELGKELKKNGNVELSVSILEKVNLKINNNINLKQGLIKSYLGFDNEKAFELLKDLANYDINPVVLAGLYMDYYISFQSKDVAIQYAKNFIDENRDIDLTKIYIKLGDIYSYKSNKNWSLARFYYEKVSPEILNFKYQYAVVLLNVREDLKAYEIFKNYFKKKPTTTNTKAISNFVTTCLRLDKVKSAGKFIYDKFLKIKTEEYSNSFISFLYQQQLKLTVNYELSETLLNHALKYSENDTTQQAIIYSNYAKHLISSSEFDIIESIENFNKSFALKPDPLIRLDIAQCYLSLKDHEKCLETLKDIREEKLLNKKNFLKIQCFESANEYDEIIGFLPKLEFRRNKQYAYLFLAENTKYDNTVRESYYKESIKFSTNYTSKFKYSIFLYSINRRKESEFQFQEIKKTLKSKAKIIQLRNRYKSQISVYAFKLNEEIINKIQNKIFSLKEWDYPLIKGINKLLEAHPLNEKIHTFKFNYFFKLKYYEKCEEILDALVELDLINHRTSELFHKLSYYYYRYSNLINFSGKIDQEEQRKALIKADLYINYALKQRKIFKYIKLNAVITYKQGNLKKHKKTITLYWRRLTDNEKLGLTDYLRKEKKKINIFLWKNNATDYFSKILFYKSQLQLAGLIIGDNTQKDKTVAIKILKSISSDSIFHSENKFYLLTEVRTRLAHYYYHIEKNYKEALKYQMKVYGAKVFDESFIGSFLSTISKLKKYTLGKKICEFYLEKNRTSLVLRHYGNYLKEMGKYHQSYNSYKEGIIFSNSKQESAILHNNILILCHESIIKNKPFKSEDLLLSTADESFKKIIKLDANFKHLSKSVKYLNDIKKRH